MQKCSRCKAVFYCNAACQTAHWKAHKLQCAPKEKKSPATGPTKA